MKYTITFIFMLTISLYGKAQSITIPDDIKLKNTEDYKKLEPLVLKSIDWFQNTPLSDQKVKRKEVASFLVQWMSGTPSVSIDIMEGLVPLKCADCMLAYMTGFTKYSLENNYESNKIKCATAGVKQSITFYKKNKKEIGKNKDIENLIKLQKKGKLNDFVKNKISGLK